MVVFIHIALGGVVGLDIRRSICLRDLLFGALLSILVTFYTITKFFFLSSVERKALYDTHLMHTLVNLILLENLLMNRSAMAYWRQISCRLMNNWPALRSPKVAASPTNEKTEVSMPENTINEVNMTDNTTKEEEDKNNLQLYNPTKESNTGIFHRDEYISTTDTRVTQRNENRENQTETATELPKIIVVQPIQDPS